MHEKLDVKSAKIRGNKTLYAIALILMLAFSAFMASISTMPTANAHTPPYNIDTYAFLSAEPNPIGVGQDLFVTMWLNVVPPTARGAGGDRWRGFTVTVTKPDGTSRTMGPYTSDAVGMYFITIVPDSVGKWYFQFSFPGQTLAAGPPEQDPDGLKYVGDYFKPCTSSKVEVDVQQQPIQSWPEIALPTDYWERPINSENRQWWSISGNWLQAGYNSTGRFNPYTKAPNTAHIVWTKPITDGGLIGGDFGSIGYYEGMTYESKFSPPIIMNGKLYYNLYQASYSLLGSQVVCVDLRTGRELWCKNFTGNGKTVTVQLSSAMRAYYGYWPGYPRLSCGQIYNYESPNQHGGQAYLWAIGGVKGTTRYDMYDAFNGNWILSFENASTGTIVFSPAGDMLVYLLDGTGNRLSMWNSSLAIPLPGPTSSDAWSWRPSPGATLDWRQGIQWNVSVPDVPGVQGGAGARSVISGDVLYTQSIIMDTYPPTIVNVGYSLKDGRQLWVQNTTNQRDPMAIGLSWAWGPAHNGVFLEFVKDTMQWYGYDLNTGNQLWGPTESYTDPWGMYISNDVLGAYGKFYSEGYDGMVRCYDIKTGEHMWDYYAGNSGFETPYGSWPFFRYMAAADGKVFANTGEHSPSKPLTRGAKLHVIDVETGKGVWNISGWWSMGSGPAIADGYAVLMNGYDNQIYCFGKGLTTTTVAASPEIVTKGSSVLIKGTVTDQSPGQQGTPAIADQDMTAWMEYQHMQKPKPADAKGVQVTLTAIDPNGNTQNIDTVTSDMQGLYSAIWTPPVEGKYTIVARFDGSESYWSSIAETAIGVSVAPSPAPTATPTATPAATPTPAATASPSPAPQPQAGPSTDMYIIAAAAVVIIVVVAVAALVLRKRK